MANVIHLVCATVRPEAPAEVVEAAIGLARGLASTPEARRVVVARSETLIIVATWVDGRAELERYAASPEQMAFVMRGLAPCVSGMWSAAVEADAPPPAEVEALWVFAVRASDSVYEWQIRALGDAVALLPGTAAAGPTFEERDRYRAGGAVCVAPGGTEAFRRALEQHRVGWGEIVPLLTEGFAPVVPA